MSRFAAARGDIPSSSLVCHGNVVACCDGSFTDHSSLTSVPKLAYNNLFASKRVYVCCGADIIYGRRPFYQGDLAGDNIALRGNNISASHTNWHYAVYQLPT
jgi:hypothetical protein